jgi:hypothetical protein
MWLELARPITLLASILSLLALTRTAFFGPDIEFPDRVYNTLCMFFIAAAFAILSGLTFRETYGRRRYGRGYLENPRFRRGYWPDYPADSDFIQRLYQTFPMKVFCFTSAVLFVLFLLNRYLQVYYLPYRNSIY